MTVKSSPFAFNKLEKGKMMVMVKIKMLKDGECNPTQQKGDIVKYKKGDVIEVKDYLVPDMVKSGCCAEFVAPTEAAEATPEQEEFNLKTAKKAELQEKAAELGLSVDGNATQLRERIEEALAPTEAAEAEEETEEGEEVDLEALDRDGLVALIEKDGLEVELTDEMDADAIRDAIVANFEEKAAQNVAPENKALGATPENK